MSTRALLTSLSPHPTYELGNALGVGDGPSDHASTLLYPPRVELVRLRDCPALRSRASHADWDAGENSDGGEAQSRWFALYHAADTLAVRELEAARSDFEPACAYSSTFNAYPTAHAVCPDADADAEDESGVHGESAAQWQQQQPQQRQARDAADTLCAAGFSNGALLLFHPFREMLRTAAGLNHTAAERGEDDNGDEVDLHSAPAGHAVPQSSTAVVAAAALSRLPPSDRALNTASTVLPMKVTCLAWEPPLLTMGRSHSVALAPCTRVVTGMADGRLLVFDTRVDKEARLDHPAQPPSPAPAPHSSEAASKKPKNANSAAGVTPVAASPPAAAAGVICARDLFSVLHAPLVASPHGSAATSLPASNPVRSWKIFAPPSAASIAARAAAVSPIAAAPSASSAGLLSPLALGINAPHNCSIVALSFSVSGAFLAVSLSSGHIAVWEWHASRLVVCLRTRYGIALSLDWSTDERLLLSGGEDDNLCVWDPFVKRALLLVGEGHASFVTSALFRPVHFVATNDAAPAAGSGSVAAASSTGAPASVWDGLYRVVSVGQDKLLLFWEFSVGGSSDDCVAQISHSSTSGEAHLQSQAQSQLQVQSQRHARRTTWKSGEELLKERAINAPPATPAAAASGATVAAAASAAAAAAATAAAGAIEISSLLIPAPRSRSSIRTFYPMAKNEASDRALAHLASGFSLRARRREQRRLWALRPPPLTVQTAVGFVPLPAAAAFGPECELAPCDDVLATVCHGLHLKFWSRADLHEQQRQQQQQERQQLGSSTSHPWPVSPVHNPRLLHLPPSTPPAHPHARHGGNDAGGSLTSRLQRLHTPILATVSPGAVPATAAADTAAGQPEFTVTAASAVSLRRESRRVTARRE